MQSLKVLDPPIACCAPLAAPALSDAEAGATAALFKALADPTRVRLVNLLATHVEPVCVCDINTRFDLSQPTLSFHLKKLTAAGIVRREQRGKWAYFSIDQQALNKLADVVGPRGGK